MAPRFTFPFPNSLFVEAVKEIGVFWALINEPAPGSIKS
jgi:hypothetical protein